MGRKHTQVNDEDCVLNVDECHKMNIDRKREKLVLIGLNSHK